MSKKVVSVSFINETVEFLETERTQSGYISFSPSLATTNESLLAACKRADEIYVNGLLPGTHYGWEVFPKVEQRYLGQLVVNFVQRKYPSESLLARFQPVREVVKDGSAGSLVAFQAVERDKIDALLGRISRFKDKIQSVHSLATALAGTVADSEKPSANFMLLWVKGDVTVITIVSPEGLVKIARTLPYGLPDESLPDLGNIAVANFAGELGREIVMTVNYFKQSFREAAPADLFVLGDSSLPQIIEKHPFEKVEATLHFSLDGTIPEGTGRDKFNENVHLMGNLYTGDAFNFLPRDEVVTRKANNILNVSLAFLAVLICLALLWTVKLPKEFSSQQQLNQVSELQSEVEYLQNSISRLQPMHAQKNFYRSAFLNEKPPFIMILQQLATIMPQQMKFSGFTMTPAGDYWDCTITGKIRGRDWQQRLDILREFGRSLYSFGNVDIMNVAHSLGQATMDSSTIDFQITMQFITGVEK